MNAKVMVGPMGLAICLCASFGFAQTTSQQANNAHIEWLNEKGIVASSANEGITLSQSQVEAINVLNRKSSLNSYKVLSSVPVGVSLSPAIKSALAKIATEREAGLRAILTPQQNAILAANLAQARRKPRP
jgi:hypothetical protein